MQIVLSEAGGGVVEILGWFEPSLRVVVVD